MDKFRRASNYENLSSYKIWYGRGFVVEVRSEAT